VSPFSAEILELYQFICFFHGRLLVIESRTPAPGGNANEKRDSQTTARP
jgi:hypothetical protein